MQKCYERNLLDNLIKDIGFLRFVKVYFGKEASIRIKEIPFFVKDTKNGEEILREENKKFYLILIKTKLELKEACLKLEEFYDVFSSYPRPTESAIDIECDNNEM